MKYVFGADIGGTTIKIGFFNENGELLGTAEIPTRTEDGGKYVLPDTSEAILRILRENGIEKCDVLGIGVGVPGPVLEDGTVNKCVNLGWGVFSVTETVESLTGIPCKAGNDANVAALGEMWKGGGSGYKSLVVVTLGTGVGGGVIINGEMIYGKGGAAGEIGHIPVTEPEEAIGICGCGKRGCLEQYVSANGIANVSSLYINEHPDEETSLRELSILTCKDVFDAAKAGDRVACKMVDTFGRTLGRALAAVGCVVDVEAFVIGGGVSKAGSIVTDMVSKYYREYAFHASADAEFTLATLGNNAGIYGGAYMVLKYQSLLENIQS